MLREILRSLVSTDSKRELNQDEGAEVTDVHLLASQHDLFVL